MHIIRVFSVGKSQKLFPTFIIILVLAGLLPAGQWQDSFYNLMGFPQMVQTLLTEAYTRDGNITVSSGYSDIYRKKIDGTTTLTLSGQDNQLLFRVPFKTGQVHHFLSGELDENATTFNNLDDETSLVSCLRIVNTNYALAWHMEGGILHFGGRYEHKSSSTPFTIDITAFPHSENATTSRYFFDLLEPTFGRELNSTLNTDQTGYSLWVLTRLSRRWRIGAALSYADFSVDWEIDYINSSPYDSLTGKRRIDTPVNGFERVYRFSLLSPQPGLQEISLICFTNKFSYFIDNNRPTNDDKSSLGKGNFGRSGIALTNHIQHKTWQFMSGLSVSNYVLDASLNTPVIGYDTVKVFGIPVLTVPIFHSAEMNLSRGNSFSQQVGFERTFSYRNLRIQAGLVYTHTLFNFWVEGTADLMCGISSTDLGYPFKYSLHLFDLHATAGWRMGPFGLNYNIQQLIPTGKRLDDSPIHFTSKTPGADYANRGGQRHQISLSYHF